MKDKETLSVFEQGFKDGYDDGYNVGCYCQGEENQNPFVEGSKEHSEWKKGYEEGFDEGYSEH